MDLKQSEQEDMIKKMYESVPIIRELYKSLYNFNHSIIDAMERISFGLPLETQIVSIDERAEFNIIEDYYLNELCNEVFEQWFRGRTKPEIRWSNKPLRSRYGLCTNMHDGTFVIAINKLLCSPDVKVDVIKYLIYHELLHANGYWHHGASFRDKEWEYPNSADLDGELDQIIYEL